MSYKKFKGKRPFDRDRGRRTGPPRLRVKWIEVTPRDKILPNLNTGKVYLEFDVLKDFYIIIKSGELKLEYDENLEQKIIDLPIEKIFDLAPLIDTTNIDEHFRIKNQLAIPGSSLKGTFRSRLELSFLARDLMPSCFITRSGGNIRSAGWRHLKVYKYDNNDIPERQQCRDASHACFVCNIFGTMGLKSKLAISDAILENSSSIIKDLRVRHGISHEEVINPGSKFKFDIYFENMSDTELGALFYVMNLSNENPILIGSHRYALQQSNGEKVKFGQGRIKTAKIELYKNIFDVINEDPQVFIKKCVEQFNQNYRGMIRELREWEVLPC
ncbi:MAG: hypothetical protein HWN67_02395 [Candidatus Helarchaeota archaeon]|nr:hypothetical protein [Candidatus Helarchaeota archaeon]